MAFIIFPNPDYQDPDWVELCDPDWDEDDDKWTGSKKSIFMVKEDDDFDWDDFDDLEFRVSGKKAEDFRSPIWTTREGKKFYNPSEIGTDHLLNIFRWLVKTNYYAPIWLIDEIQRRGLQIPDVQRSMKEEIIDGRKQTRS